MIILIPAPRFVVTWVLLLLPSVYLLRVMASLAVLILAIGIRPLVLLTRVVLIHASTWVYFLMIILSFLIVIPGLVRIVVIAIVSLLSSLHRWVGLTITLCIVRCILIAILVAVLAVLFFIIILVLVVLVTLISILLLNLICFSGDMPILAPLAIAVAILACCWTVWTSFAVVTVTILVFALLFHVLWFSIVLIILNMLQIPVLFVFNLVRNFIMPKFYCVIKFRYDQRIIL